MTESDERQRETMEAAARLADLRRKRDIKLRLRALNANYGLNFYRPHAKQHKFHTCGKIGRYGRTGNRFGKSEMGIAEDLAWCIGGRVWYQNAFDIVNGEGQVVERHPGGKDHPYVTVGIPQRPVKGLLIVVDWDMANLIFTNRSSSNKGKLFRMLPSEALGKVHVSRGGHVDQVEIKRLTEFGGGSSTIRIDTIESYKHNKLGAESADWDFIHVDEPCPQDMFTAHSRGLMDRNGSYWFTCTPLDEMWINDEFCPPHKSMVKDSGPDGLSFDKRFIITGSIYDNPHRNAAGVEEFKSRITREEQACRLHGLPYAMAGLVYKEFIHDLHVLCDPPAGWKDYHLPPDDYTIRVWWDYHTRLPQAVLFFATDTKGRIFVYDELFDDNKIDPVARAIINKTKNRFVATHEIDPFAVIPHPVTGESVVDELMKYDLYFEKATKDLSTGIIRTCEKLAERDHAGNPTIYFSPRLTQTLWEFTHYVYDLKKNEPKDENNHMMENLYRAVLNGLDYVEAPKDEEYRARKHKAISFAEDHSMWRTPNLTV